MRAKAVTIIIFAQIIKCKNHQVVSMQNQNITLKCCLIITEFLLSFMDNYFNTP